MNRRRFFEKAVKAPALAFIASAAASPLQEVTLIKTTGRRFHDKTRLAAECAKLDPAEEVAMAEGIFPAY